MDEDDNVKISDFGLSALFDAQTVDASDKMCHTMLGTPNYVAPEVLLEKG